MIDLTTSDGVRPGTILSLRRDRIPIIHPAKVDPDGARITLYSDFFGTNLSTLNAALTAYVFALMAMWPGDTALVSCLMVMACAAITVLANRPRSLGAKVWAATCLIVARIH